MNWPWRRKQPAPTAAGELLGVRPGSPGFVNGWYSCGHVVALPSPVRMPDQCPNPEHQDKGRR